MAIYISRLKLLVIGQALSEHPKSRRDSCLDIQPMLKRPRISVNQTCSDLLIGGISELRHQSCTLSERPLGDRIKRHAVMAQAYIELELLKCHFESASWPEDGPEDAKLVTDVLEFTGPAKVVCTLLVLNRRQETDGWDFQTNSQSLVRKREIRLGRESQSQSSA